MTYTQVINGTTGSDILFGGAGNDLLTGGAGSDLFVISKGSGSDTISDFQAGAGGDALRVQNYSFPTFASFMSAATQSGADVIVTLASTETLTLQNVALSSLTAANVILDNPLPVSASPNTAWTTVGAGGTLTGGATNDSLQAMGDGVTLIGGAGDDSYFMYNHETKVAELAGQGIDTIYDGMIDGYSLVNAPNVENLTLGGSYHAPATGNDLDNIIVGSAGNNLIDGGKGNDVLTGGTGSDTFAVRNGNGNDIITDFQTGAGGDILQINGTNFKTLADVTAAMQQVGTDVVLSLGNGEKITLENAKVQNFTTANINIVTAPARLIQTFGDDFNSLSAGQDPHLTWKTSYAWSGVASYTLSGEQEVYVDPSFTGLPGTQASSSLGLNPFSIQNGHLVITAAPIPSSDLTYVGNHQFSSGVITTENSFVQTYGYFEMKATLSDTKGAWPAFWMLPINTHGQATELDVFEALGRDPDQAHWGFVSSTTASQGYWANTANLTAGDHTFGVEWTPYTLTYFVDGVEVGRVATPSDMNTAMYMIANLAMGGSWAGSADPSATAQMSIDYIKAYQLQEYTLANYTLLTSGNPTTTIAGTSNADTLTGTSGNDLLGGAGRADTMTGGLGDDTYIVTDPGAKVVEGYGGGVDSVMSSVSYALPDYVENLTLTGSAAINGTGNFEANIIIGNDAVNIITGGLGNDILSGGGGADTFVINSGDGSDIITDFTPGAATGHDVVHLNGFAFTSFNDVKAAMTQAGNDVYLALTSQDTLVFRNTTISAFTIDDFQLPSTLPVGGAITSWISGSTSSHIVYGTAANDQITAVNSDDTLVGWSGDDTYVIGNPNQKIVENPGGGIDNVQAWSSYNLPANVENLTLMTGGLTGVGNDLANRMVGSSGNDILNGAGGDDWLFGGAGNDTFIYGVGSGHDTLADFHVFTSATAEHDKLVLKGYDSSAYLTNAGDEWTVHYAGGADSFRIAGVTQLSSSDYAFVSASGALMTSAGLTAPTISLVGATSSAAGGLTNANHLTLTGTAQAGVIIKVFDQTAQIGVATVDGNGIWCFATSALADGSHAFAAIATDNASDVSVVSNSLTITIDATAPKAPSVASFSPDSNIASDGITNANQLTLAGAAEAGSQVLVFDGTAQLGTVMVDASGNWLFVTGTLGDGAHAFTGKAVDAAGNVSATPAPLTATVDSIAPNAPTIISDTLGPSNVVLSGTAEAGSVVRVYEGSALLGAAVTGANGAWTVTTGSLAAGAHAFTATSTDAAGNTSSPSSAFDPIIGTSIESAGATSLTQVGSNYVLNPTAGGNGPTLKFNGVVYVAGQFSNWTPIGAEATSTGYDVAWKNTSTGVYTVWTADSNGNFTSNLLSNVSGTSAPFQSIETLFKQDLNGDGVIGLRTTIIEASGATSLVQAGSNYLLNLTAEGNGPTLKFNGVVYVAGQFSNWTPIGAEATSTGYDVAWKNTSTGVYTVWTADSNGNFTSNLLSNVSGTSAAFESIETLFQQDLNGDGVIGLRTTIIEASGATSLVQAGSNYLLNSTAEGNGPTLKFNGVVYVAGQFSNWTPIGAEATSSGYDVAWKNTSTGVYTVWAADSNGNFTSNLLSNVSGTSAAFQSIETLFKQDLNGDGVIGLRTTIIEASGATSLVQAGSNYLLNSTAEGNGPTLKFNGVVYVAGQFSNWTPIGAEATSSGYDVAWKNTSSGIYTVWTADNNGNFTSNLLSNVSGTSAAFESIETLFQQDLNGDGVIGLRTTIIEASGTTSLVQAGSNYLLNPAAGGNGPTLKYNGAAYVAGQFSNWTPIAAEAASGGYDIAWKNSSTGVYTVWTADNNGNFISNLLSNVSETSTFLKSIEVAFHQDLNGDGAINTSSTVLDISGKIVLTVPNLSQPVTLEPGAVLELTGAASGFVTFKGATGTLVLDHSTQFAGTIYGLSGDGDPSSSDILDLKDISFGSGTQVSYSGSTSRGVLTVSDAQNHTAQITLTGDYTHSTFNLSSDGSGGTLVIDPPMDQFNCSSARASTPPPMMPLHTSLIGDAFIFTGTGAAGSMQRVTSTDHVEDRVSSTANHIGVDFNQTPHFEITSHVEPTDLHAYLLHV